jgi:hypothetical protein
MVTLRLQIQHLELQHRIERRLTAFGTIDGPIAVTKTGRNSSKSTILSIAQADHPMLTALSGDLRRSKTRPGSSTAFSLAD